MYDPKQDVSKVVSPQISATSSSLLCGAMKCNQLKRKVYFSVALLLTPFSEHALVSRSSGTWTQLKTFFFTKSLQLGEVPVLIFISYMSRGTLFKLSEQMGNVALNFQVSWEFQVDTWYVFQFLVPGEPSGMQGLEREMGDRENISSMSLGIFGIHWLYYSRPNASHTVGGSLRTFGTLPNSAATNPLTLLWV